LLPSIKRYFFLSPLLFIVANAATYSHAESVTSPSDRDVPFKINANDYSPAPPSPAFSTGYLYDDKLNIILVAENEANTTTYTYGAVGGQGPAAPKGGTTIYTYGPGKAGTGTPKGRTTTYTYDKGAGRTEPPAPGGLIPPPETPPSEPPVTVSGCAACHQRTIEEISAYKVPHAAFVIEKCEMCHITGKGIGIPVKDYADAHLIVLNDLIEGVVYNVRVSINDRRGREKSSDPITFTPGSIREFLSNAPLNISGVRLTRVEARIFTEAEVEWETDKFATSTVEYGLTEKYGTTVSPPYFVKSHRVRISALKNPQVYHYRVISTDPFGKRAVSADLTIDTSKTFGAPAAPAGPGPEFEQVRVLRLAPEGTTFDKRVGIVITATSEVRPTVEFSKVLDPTKKHNEWELKSLAEAGSRVCHECHKAGVSHPVDVPAYRVPSVLPTAEGRVMVCVTCHRPHGGDIQSLMRYDQKNEICVLCHTHMQ
jgi:predicted CXXCH cytochrome family protein